MNNRPVIDHHKLREEKSPAFARHMVKMKYNELRNITKTAEYFGITRATVRRAIYGEENDISRKPKSSPDKTPEHLENLIVFCAKETGFKYIRLKHYILEKYGIEISENTIKKILKRNGIVRSKKKRREKTGRHLYDYEKLLPFSQMQMDTKYILNKKSLPVSAYNYAKRSGLPLYEWNIIDAKTRIKFTAYSYKLNSTYGFLFVFLVLSWIRLHGVRWKINIRMDNGSEFCGSSARKEKAWEEKLKMFDVRFERTTPGKPYMNGIVESYHRACDEYFLVPYIERCRDVRTFMIKAQKWQDAWNWYRRHGGIGMRGLTPVQKLKETRTLIHKHIASFPVLLMEVWMMIYKDVMKFTNTFSSTGQYVRTKCLCQ